MPEVKPRGRIDAPIVFVGDAPTEEDFIEGKAWSGAVGELMVDVLKRVGIDPDEILFLNAVSYGRPSKDYKFTADDIIPDSDRYLIPTIAMHPRKLIVAFGNNALCAVGVVPKPEKVLSLRMKPLTSPTLEDNGVVCPITCSVHPWSVLREPDESESFMTDLRFAYRALNEDMELIFQTQAPMVIHDIEDPDQIDDLYKHVVKIGEVAYDYETTGLNPRVDYPVTLSLCDGRVDQNKKNIVHWWASHDRLNMRFSEQMLIGFKEKWHWFFSRAGEDYNLISWNGNFDDWMSQTWLDDAGLPGSQFDAMLMKWQLNNKRPHGLKEATARYLGYPNYDEAVDIAVKEIKARRTKILRDEEDFFVVNFFGLETVKTKTGQKWPEGVDKGLAAYAMIDYNTLREYGCYDALYTLKLKRLFGEQIEKEDLMDACDLRHRIRQELLRCQQRGMLVDVETARSFSKELEAIGDACDKKIEVQLAEMGITIPNFNPNSGPQVIEVLFGKPIEVPLLLPGTLVNRDMSYKIAEERCRIVEEAIYGENFKLLREVVHSGQEFNAPDAERRLRDEYRRRFSTSTAPGVKRMPMYLNGTHEPAGFTKSGLPSTGSAILQSINQQNPSDFLSLLLMQRRAVKLRGTFVEGVLKRMDESNVIRPFFNTIGTETGRISSSNPNGQNFVKSLRGMLVPRPGYRYLEWDLSQAEIRAVAAYSQDEGLIAALNSSDIHSTIAAMIFNVPVEKIGKDSAERRYAKTIVFGIIYGMSAWRLHMAIGVTLEQAEEFIEKFFAAFPKLKMWLEKQVRLAKRYPYYVYTPWGTRRSTLNMRSVDKKVISHTERIAMNMPIQGAAGELTLFYICEIMDRVRAGLHDCHLVNTTHDSCTLEVAESLVWEEPSGEKDKDGKDIMKIAGPIVDIVNEVINNVEVLPHPLNTVNFVADMELNDHWSGKPNLKKAVDPKWKESDGTGSLRWDLIAPDQNLDADEYAELMEAEEVAMS
jgi:uracil-DNA glycosylase family 4